MNPDVWAAGLIALLVALVALQRRIGPRTTWPNRVRRVLWPALDPLGRRLGQQLIGRPRPFVREKDRAEYVCSVNCSKRELQQALHDYGYRRNLLSTLKFNLNPDSTKSWERGSWAYRTRLRDKWMHHCYFFKADERGYTYHLHHHKEVNYLNSPRGHMGEQRIPGDPHSHLIQALSKSGVAWERMEYPQYR